MWSNPNFDVATSDEGHNLSRRPGEIGRTNDDKVADPISVHEMERAGAIQKRRGLMIKERGNLMVQREQSEAKGRMRE
jgi:hypothetical protein